uniref:Uncharacterized protein n=1 Tax=Vespula pensylvanica TaxID=30213 RepID=A0A834UC28_VESPE|nr:hypothetical protein H0235_006058 [Vespula pensylvanica]
MADQTGDQKGVKILLSDGWKESKGRGENEKCETSEGTATSAEGNTLVADRDFDQEFWAQRAGGKRDRLLISITQLGSRGSLDRKDKSLLSVRGDRRYFLGETVKDLLRQKETPLEITVGYPEEDDIGGSTKSREWLSNTRGWCLSRRRKSRKMPAVEDKGKRKN